MKTTYTLESAINYLVNLMHSRFGYRYIPSSFVSPSPSLLGTFHPEQHRYLDTIKIPGIYEQVERTEKEKEEYRKKPKKNALKQTFIEKLESEDYKYIYKKAQQPRVIMTIDIMRSIKQIISQFPNDFLVSWEDSASGRGRCTIFFVQSFGPEAISKEIVFSFLGRHCTTTAKEKILSLVQELFENENNKKLLKIFKKTIVRQYEKETAPV